MSRAYEGFGGRSVRYAMTTRFDTLPYGMSSPDLARLLSERGQSVFPVVDGNMRLLGLASREGLIQGLNQANPGPWAAVRSVPLLPPDLPALNALQTMQSSGEGILPVVNSSAQIVGLVSAASLTGHRP